MFSLELKIFSLGFINFFKVYKKEPFEELASGTLSMLEVSTG